MAAARQQQCQVSQQAHGHGEADAPDPVQRAAALLERLPLDGGQIGAAGKQRPITDQADGRDDDHRQGQDGGAQARFAGQRHLGDARRHDEACKRAQDAGDSRGRRGKRQPRVFRGRLAKPL
jgi:hypothetical protein